MSLDILLGLVYQCTRIRMNKYFNQQFQYNLEIFTSFDMFVITKYTPDIKKDPISLSFMILDFDCVSIDN